MTSSNHRITGSVRSNSRASCLNMNRSRRRRSFQAPDPIRLAIPKAYVLLVSGAERSPETALSIFRHLHTRLAPFKRIRRIELVTELPKTISGKIRRVQLRRLEHENDRGDPLRGQEFREEDFPELRKVRTAGSVEN